MKVLGEFYPYTHGQTIGSADYLAPNKLADIGIDESDIPVAQTGVVQTAESFAELRKTAPSTMIVLHHIKEPDMLAAFKHEGTVVGSDSNAFPPAGDPPLTADSLYGYGAGHPRAAPALCGWCGSRTS